MAAFAVYVRITRMTRPVQILKQNRKGVSPFLISKPLMVKIRTILLHPILHNPSQAILQPPTMIVSLQLFQPPSLTTLTILQNTILTINLLVLQATSSLYIKHHILQLTIKKHNKQPDVLSYLKSLLRFVLRNEFLYIIYLVCSEDCIAEGKCESSLAWYF